MIDPKLTKTSIYIRYESDDGFVSETRCGSSHIDDQDPQDGLLAGLEELARLTALFGFEEEALIRFNAARQRVFEWREKRRNQGAEVSE